MRVWDKYKGYGTDTRGMVQIWMREGYGTD